MGAQLSSRFGISSGADADAATRMARHIISMTTNRQKYFARLSGVTEKPVKDMTHIARKAQMAYNVQYNLASTGGPCCRHEMVNPMEPAITVEEGCPIRRKRKTVGSGAAAAVGSDTTSTVIVITIEQVGIMLQDIRCCRRCLWLCFISNFIAESRK